MVALTSLIMVTAGLALAAPAANNDASEGTIIPAIWEGPVDAFTTQSTGVFPEIERLTEEELSAFVANGET